MGVHLCPLLTSGAKQFGSGVAVVPVHSCGCACAVMDWSLSVLNAKAPTTFAWNTSCTWKTPLATTIPWVASDAVCAGAADPLAGVAPGLRAPGFAFGAGVAPFTGGNAMVSAAAG